MLLQLALSIALGVLAGILTGITPGIYVNLVSILAITLITGVEPLYISVFIVSLAITHTFLDAIPSIYLGAPDSGTVLNVLPGHRLLLQGKGHLAVKMTVVGSLLALVMCAILFPVFLVAMKILQPLVQKCIAWLLIGLTAFLIFREKKWYYSLLVFSLSGMLGYAVLNTPNLSQPLFGLLSGLFGVSILIVSMMETSALPIQDFKAKSEANTKSLLKGGAISSITGFAAAFLPGFGSSQAAIMAQYFADKGDEAFLALVSGINTANMLVSIATVYALQKARNGAIVCIQQIMEVDYQAMIIFLAACLMAGGIASILTIILSKYFLKIIQKVNYIQLCFWIIVFIVFLSSIFDGFLGLVILIASASLGLFTSKLGIGKNHLMGCLIVPVIIYFL